jgi:hypothetical protein
VLRFAIVLAEVAINRGLEVDERMENAALQSPTGERCEEGLDRIGPRAGGRCEMKHPARVPSEPSAHLDPTSTVLRKTVAEIRGIAADAISCTVLWC